jgi:hypothetical protein
VFLTQRHKAADSAAKSDLANVALMARSVEVNNGAYPTTYVEAAEPSTPDPATVYYKRSPGVGAVQSVTLADGSLCLQVTSASGTVLSWRSADGSQSEGSCPGL